MKSRLWLPDLSLHCSDLHQTGRCVWFHLPRSPSSSHFSCFCRESGRRGAGWQTSRPLKFVPSQPRTLPHSSSGCRAGRRCLRLSASSSALSSVPAGFHQEENDHRSSLLPSLIALVSVLHEAAWSGPVRWSGCASAQGESCCRASVRVNSGWL